MGYAKSLTKAMVHSKYERHVVLNLATSRKLARQEIEKDNCWADARDARTISDMTVVKSRLLERFGRSTRSCFMQRSRMASRRRIPTHTLGICMSGG